MIKSMAFYCCGIREADAQSERPIVGDIYAGQFMTSAGREVLERFNSHGDKAPKVVNLVRGRVLQDEIARRLKENPNLQIVNIGAGFDSRAYRMAGGTWLEVDDAALIEHKNRRLPAKLCPNPLRRAAVDFTRRQSRPAATHDELPTALIHVSREAETLVVIEGVLMYLDQLQIGRMLTQLKVILGSHTVLCELLDKTFIDRFMSKNTREQTEALGSPFLFREPQPERMFLDWLRGGNYTQSDKPVSVVQRAAELGALPASALLKLLLRGPLRSMRDGYRVHTFEFKEC